MCYAHTVYTIYAHTVYSFLYLTNHRTSQKVLMCYAHTVYSFLYLNLNKKIFVVSTAVSTLNLVDL